LSHFNYQRALILGKPTSERIVLLPIHFWEDSSFGFILSKRYLGEGYCTYPIECTVSGLSEVGLKIEKESVQEGYPVNIGEKFQVEHKGKFYNATVIGIVEKHYILVLDTPINKDKKHLGGYAMYFSVFEAEKMIKEGKWKPIDEWEGPTVTSSLQSANFIFVLGFLNPLFAQSQEIVNPSFSLNPVLGIVIALFAFTLLIWF